MEKGCADTQRAVVLRMHAMGMAENGSVCISGLSDAIVSGLLSTVPKGFRTETPQFGRSSVAMPRVAARPVARIALKRNSATQKPYLRLRRK